MEIRVSREAVLCPRPRMQRAACERQKSGTEKVETIHEVPGGEACNRHVSLAETLAESRSSVAA
jgi:hypothetical protein